jgi:acetyl esterase/lipase
MNVNADRREGIMFDRVLARVGATLLLAGLLVTARSGLADELMTFEQIEELPQPEPGLQIAYGDAPSQFGESRFPAGEGPHPVVMLIHGGCWREKYGVDHIAPIAADLARHGVATWAIEYRRLGEPGGGWPGTFEDIAAALEKLEDLGDEYPLDTERVVVAGHSAGGHLALWLASRDRLPADHPWHAISHRDLAGVVGLSPITDLAEYAAGSGDCNTAVPILLGEDSARYAERLALASPDRIMPPTVPVRLIHGREDDTVPLSQTLVYSSNVNEAGGDSRHLVLDGTGHFELIAPFTEAWERSRSVILSLLAEAPAQEER